MEDIRRLPSGAGIQPTAEMKAEVTAINAEAALTQAASKAQIDAHLESFAPNGESNQWGRTNVATLKPEEMTSKISQITNLIQSGEAEKYEFFSGNGEVTTRSIHQYLYWLQIRQQGIDGDGTYTPATATE
ncbi:hypothetical protein D3Y55_25125 [Mesorhizobium sp. DCY119]|nr:hypothetical protein D3Y55_25125 [Mesorhizobium sp. DCY119]